MSKTERPEESGTEQVDQSDDTEGMSPLAQAYARLGPYLGIAWMFVFSLGLGMVVGRWLDNRLGTNGLMLIGGALVGIFLGFLNFFKVVIGFNSRKKPSDEKR